MSSDAQTPRCSTHTAAPATYQCDGCRALLCGECVQESHRLTLCRRCGELAVPLPGARPGAEAGRGKSGPKGSRQAMDPPGVRVRRRPTGPDTTTLADALAYPFRGTGAGVFWVYWGLLVLFDGLPRLLPISGCVLFLPAILVALLVPRLVLTIIDTTSEGENQLPDWPELEFGERFADALTVGMAALVALLPGVVLFFALGCTPLDFLGPTGGGHCWAVLFAALALWVLLLLPAVAALAVFDDLSRLVRLDLHLRALLVAPGETLLLVGTATFLLASGIGLRVAIEDIPVLDVMLSNLLWVYCLFTVAHLAGLWFRRHGDRLEELYYG